jgi:hypothetical protein
LHWSTVFFTTGILTWNAGNVFTTMLVTLAKVALSNRYLAMRTIAEFDTRIATVEIRANELFSMFDIFRDDKICSL